MQGSPDKYVEFALAQAAAYIGQNKYASNMQGKTPEETVEIQAFLDSKPYDNDKVRAAVKEMIEDRLAGKMPASDGAKPTITYLAGPLGSKQMLQDMAGKESAEVGPEVKAALDGAVFSDFTAYKTMVSTKLLDGGKVEPYAKYRPLLSGVDQAVQAAAAEMKYNQVIDNTMALADEKVQGGLAHLKAQAKNNSLRMYAVALSPAQSKAEAAKLGMSEAEAEASARNFRRSFPGLLNTVPNVTLVDREGAIIYQQLDGTETRRDKVKMEVWAGAFREGLPPLRREGDAPSSGLPPMPGSGGGEIRR